MHPPGLAPWHPAPQTRPAPIPYIHVIYRPYTYKGEKMSDSIGVEMICIIMYMMIVPVRI